MAFVMKRLVPPLANALVATFLAWIAGFLSPVQTFEGRTIDWRFLSRGPHEQRPAQTVLVLVEEEADLPYRSPIPRRHLAAVIDQLSEAKLIGLDILLDKPSFDEEADEELRHALAQGNNVVAVSYLKDGREHKPHPSFADSLLDIGYATFVTGKDIEIVRRGTVTWDLEDHRALSLAGCIYARHLGLDTQQIREGTAGDLPDGDLLIDFAGPPNAVYRRHATLTGGFVVCPSHLVATGVYPPSFFRDKFVFVGSGLLDAPDQFRTPYFSSAYGHEKMFGVEIHAHFLQTLLDPQRLEIADSAKVMWLSFLLALLVGIVVVFRHAAESAAVFVVCLLALWIGGFYQFTEARLVLPLVVPSLGIVLSFGAMQAYHALTEGRDKRHTRQMFEKYLAPEVINEFIEDPSNWELGGKRMDITVMFADLEGFTPLSETLEPEQLVKLINEYFTEMSALILEEGGTIDKYEGDLIMAFFGAPVPQTDHADRACRAAMKMQHRMRDLRKAWKSRGFSELRVRIGVNSGPAVVGNMGSDFRFNYTAMGDTVNLASRLESANKDFGTYILASHETRMRVYTGLFSFRGLGEVQVKGRSEPVKVYELTSAAVNPRPDFAAQGTGE